MRFKFDENFLTGNVEVFGKIGNAYDGIAPDAPSMDPY